MTIASLFHNGAESPPPSLMRPSILEGENERVHVFVHHDDRQAEFAGNTGVDNLLDMTKIYPALELQFTLAVLRCVGMSGSNTGCRGEDVSDRRLFLLCDADQGVFEEVDVELSYQGSLSHGQKIEES